MLTHLSDDEAEKQAKQRRERIALTGDELISKTAVIRKKAKGNLLYIEDEVEDIFRI